MTDTEIYLSDDIYDREVAKLVETLSLDHYDLDHRRAHIAFTMDPGQAIPAERLSPLIDALARMQPGGWGATEIEPGHVSWVLGEEGGVWPEGVREDNELPEGA